MADVIHFHEVDLVVGCLINFARVDDSKSCASCIIDGFHDVLQWNFLGR